MKKTEKTMKSFAKALITASVKGSANSAATTFMYQPKSPKVLRNSQSSVNDRFFIGTDRKMAEKRKKLLRPRMSMSADTASFGCSI